MIQEDEIVLSRLPLTSCSGSSIRRTRAAEGYGCNHRRTVLAEDPRRPRNRVRWLSADGAGSRYTSHSPGQRRARNVSDPLPPSKSCPTATGSASSSPQMQHSVWTRETRPMRPRHQPGLVGLSSFRTVAVTGWPRLFRSARSRTTCAALAATEPGRPAAPSAGERPGCRAAVPAPRRPGASDRRRPGGRLPKG